MNVPGRVVGFALAFGLGLGLLGVTFYVVVSAVM